MMSNTMPDANHRAVLLLAYGTPNDLGDMAAYLLDIRGGRPTPEALVEEMTERYRAIGGSPLNRHTGEQAAALGEELDRRGRPLPVYVGMRHWTPWIAETVSRMREDGVREATAIVMAPHYSSLSVGRYEECIEAAQAEQGNGIVFHMVRSWWRQTALLAAFEEKAHNALARFDERDGMPLKVVFTAHSLPSRILEQGDPYDDELKENARVLADRLGEIDWTFAYQSAGASPEPWLGPSLEDVVPKLAEEGYRGILVAPLGFVCDHVEILYDLDIEAKQIAETCGIRLERTESLNTTPAFIRAVADAVEASRSEANAESGRTK